MNVRKLRSALGFLLILSAIAVASSLYSNMRNTNVTQSVVASAARDAASSGQTYSTNTSSKLVATPSPTKLANLQDAMYVHELLYGKEGTIIAQGTNTVPTGPRKMKTYQVEEVLLPGLVSHTVLVPSHTGDSLQLRTITIEKVWRLTITAEGLFYEGELPLGVWFDDTLVGMALDSPSGISSVLYDRSQLREGATIGVGLVSRGPTILLPEKLQLNTSR